jgi:hypothetical protein
LNVKIMRFLLWTGISKPAARAIVGPPAPAALTTPPQEMRVPAALIVALEQTIGLSIPAVGQLI